MEDQRIRENGNESEEIIEERRDRAYTIRRKKILDLERKEAQIRYSNIDGERVKVRDTKLMALVQRQRLNEKMVMGKKRENYEVNRCDACGAEFKKGEPECHHIIPFEIDGTDNS